MRDAEPKRFANASAANITALSFSRSRFRKNLYSRTYALSIDRKASTKRHTYTQTHAYTLSDDSRAEQEWKT